MSHVDEGRLHAFLDGALSAADPADAERVELHLASCADCRAKLDEAARLRDEAATLLGRAQPRAFEMPSFDAIRARASALAAAEVAGAAEAAGGIGGLGAAAQDRAASRASRAGRAIFVSPFNGLAWAATLVLAVGLGWLLRDTVDESGMRPMSDIAAVPMRRPAPERAASVANEAMDADGATETPRPEPSRVGESRAGESQTGDRTPTQRRAAGERAEYGVTTGQAAGAGDQDNGVEQYAVEENELALPRNAVADEAPPVLGEPLAARRQAASVPARPMAREAAPPPAALPPSAPAPSAMAGVGAESAAPERLGDGWRALTIADAERATDGELFVIRDARVESAASRETGSDLEVRTVQRTSRGEIVQVLQRRIDDVDRQESRAAMAADAAAESAAPAATVRRGDWTVTISGAVDADRLEELLDDLP